MLFNSVGLLAILASTSFVTARHHDVAAPSRSAPPACATDSNYQRLAFWVGEWDVVDSAGAHYATQRVRAVLDDCAITAEWTGRAGDKGLNLSAFDRTTGEWRQVYASNQVPAPMGIQMRRSDPSYGGPGVRFIALIDPPSGTLARSRVTIMPLSGRRAMQLFEDSNDGGRTWRVLFKAEHRRLTPDP